MFTGCALAGLLMPGCGRLGYAELGLTDRDDASFEDSGTLDARVAFTDGSTAGLDAGVLDAGVLDAGALDAGSDVDAGTPDAGGLDAGMTGEDAAVDASTGTDAGMEPDAGMDAGSPPIDPCPTGALVCGDFENDFGVWNPRRGRTGTWDFVTTPARVGTHALRLQTASNESFVRVDTDPGTLTSGTLHGRVFLWVGATTTVDDYVVALQLDDGDDSGAQKMSLDLRPNGEIILTLNTSQPSVELSSGAGAVSRNTWHCFDFSLDLDATDGSVRFSHDGSVVGSAASVRTIPAGGAFTRMSVLGVSTANGVKDLIFDGVVLSRSPVPCP